jgi:hypothetical protein
VSNGTEQMAANLLDRRLLPTFFTSYWILNQSILLSTQGEDTNFRNCVGKIMAAYEVRKEVYKVGLALHGE